MRCLFLAALSAAPWGCTAIIGASEPTARVEIDASVALAPAERTDDASVSATEPTASPGTDEGDAPNDGSSTDDGGLAPAMGVTADATTDASKEGGCVDTIHDPHNCGVCGHDCTMLPHVVGAVTCAASGQCAFALASCAAGWTHCASDADQGCETSLTTPSNCGGCGAQCPSSTPLCSGTGSAYACANGCSGALSTRCGSACVDTGSDPANCATCAHACPNVTGGQPTCSNGVCSVQCNSGYSNCSGACVDETSDDTNCNGCGTKCVGGEHCTSGACQCTGGTHSCGGTCVANDDSACGATCVACTAPTGGSVSCNGTACAQTCTAAGNAVCSNVCVNESTDVGNCGGCGTSCSGATPYCVGGGCVACTGGSQCVSGNTPQTCVKNAWVSQAACAGSTPVCLNGACVACTSGAQCAAGWVQSCVDDEWVNQTMCASTQVCRTAACVNAVHDVGQDTALASTFALSANYMYVFRLPKLANSATVLGFGAYGTPATAANAKMAIYADDGTGAAPSGQPLDWIGTYLTLSSGQVQQSANTTGPLSSGTYYWLGIDVDTATTLYSQTSSGIGVGFSQPYGTYPSGMAGSSYSGIDLAIYVSVQDLN